ncbi:hypothetical protein [Terriglobus tenax]|uniref:hypothetical protein n=1 Tax=Terriglobus tenax TaxID=1111115 RepID=UPI0021E009B7|nr:hypothetical protein [Terriglobus tenax]
MISSTQYEMAASAVAARREKEQEETSLEQERQVEAFARVYRKYGSDISSFLRDVQDELAEKKEESRKPQRHLRMPAD